MDAHALLARIFDHIENRDEDKAVRSSLRLARHMGDYLNTAFFLRELIEDRTEIARVLRDDTSHLKEDAQKYIFERSLDRWLTSRTLSFSLSTDDSGEEKNVLVIPVGELQAELEQCEKSITDFALPPSMGEYDTAAFTDRYNGIKADLRLRMKAISTIQSRVLNHCLNFAIQVERQLGSQRKTMVFLERAQNEVQNYFKSRSDDVYEKLQKANQLVDSNSKEDHSLLLTEVRRAIKAVADYFYPASLSPVLCSDGVERVLGDDKYLNRLEEFVQTKCGSSTSAELLGAELGYLMVFARRLNAAASKGVHTNVTMPEAKQGFLGLYMFLYNVCQHIEIKGA